MVYVDDDEKKSGHGFHLVFSYFLAILDNARRTKTTPMEANLPYGSGFKMKLNAASTMVTFPMICQ